MTGPGTTQAPAPAVTDEGWLRLDSRTIWVAPLRPLGTLLLTGLVIVTFRGWDKLGLTEPLIGLAVAVGAFALSAWSWSTTRYRITPTHVELRSGILVRKHRAVARDRLRTVDITADLLHRVAGLAIVSVGTGRQGGEADDELKLESLARSAADELRTVLLARRPAVVAPVPAVDGATAPPAPAPEPGEELLSQFDARWVLLAPLSLMGLVAVAVVAGAGAQLLRTALGDEVFNSAAARAAWAWATSFSVLGIVAVVLVVLLVANAVLSPVLYVLVYGGYRLTRHHDSLHVTYGLITQRSVTIEERRIRGVRLAEPLLLRAVRAGRLAAVAAGLGAKKDSEGKDSKNNDMLLPTAPVDEAHRVTAAVLRCAESPLGVPMRRHPAAALRPIALQWSLFALPAIVLDILAALDVVPTWLPEAAIVLVVAGVAGVWLEYANLGHARAGDHLVARHGSGVRTTTAVRCDGIIAWQFRRTVLQRRPRLLTATAAVAAGKGAHTIRYAAQDAVLPIARDAVPGLLDPFLEPDT